MNILLIGHSIIDHIERDEIEFIKAGGIFYTAFGMLLVKEPNDNIYLLTGVNSNCFNLFEKVYSKISRDYIVELNNMPEVYLIDYAHKERDEFYKNISSNLSLEKICDWSMFDGILINMITGFDINIEQLKLIRENFPGKIYFDVHTMSRGVNENMKREFRQIPDVEEWLLNIDLLQCNENELKTIFNVEKKEERIKKILSLGVNVVILTKGGRGAEIFYKENGQIKNYSVAGIKVKVKNKIGCGDIFGAVFFYSYLRTNDLYASLVKANKMAALVVSENIFDKINN